MANIKFPAVVTKSYRQHISSLRSALSTLATYLEYQPKAGPDVQAQFNAFFNEVDLEGGGTTVSGSIKVPAGLGFTPPTTFRIAENGALMPMLAAAAKTPEEVFDEISVARKAPTTTLYVGKGGIDSQNGLTWGTRKLNISAAIQTGNATGNPYRVFVGAGEYIRQEGFQALSPTQDVAFIAYRGPVVTGTFDAFTGFVLDTEFPACYSATVGTVDKLNDRLRLNDFGLTRQLQLFATPAALQAATTLGDGGYAYANGKLYVRRQDGAAPTAANTRFYRNIRGLYVDQPVSVYIEGFTLEGGQMGAFDYAGPANMIAERRVVGKNCRFLYGGGNTNTDGRSLSVDSLNGLAAFFDCEASGGRTDGFNFHDIRQNGERHLTVRCIGNDNGRGSSQSCNGLTGHDGTLGVDVGGSYEWNRGGTVRQSEGKIALFGTYIANDQGDGTTLPTAVMTSGVAEYWLDRVTINMPSNRQAVLATQQSVIHIHQLNNVNGAVVGGSGTIDENWTP